MSKTEKKFAAYLILIVLFLGFKACQENAPAPQPQQEAQKDSAIKPKRQVKPSSVLGTGPWPPLSDETKTSDTPTAKNCYVILDTSGSMKNSVNGRRKIAEAKTAMLSFGDSVPEDINLGLTFFAGEVVPLGVNNRDRFRKRITSVRPGGGTPLVETLKKSYQALTLQAQRQSGYGSYQLIVVTDGKSGDGNPAPLAAEIVKKSPIEIHVIGFGLDDHALNIPGVTQYVTARSANDLMKALTSVTMAETETFSDASEFDEN